MKKTISILLSLTMLLSLVACGGNTTPSDADNTPASSQQEDNKDNAEESKNNASDNQNVSDEIGEVALKDVEDTIAALVAEYEKLVADIDTYDKYLEETNTIEAFYTKVCEETELLCIKVREYSISYAEFIMSSDKSNDDKYDEFDEIYDYLYDDAGDEIYDEIYDGILADMYDDFYDGILDDAYDNAPYDEWSDARSNEYEWWSDSRSAVYDTWSDYRSDVYDFWSDMRGELWDDDIEKAEEEIEDFRADIEKLKEKEESTSFDEPGNYESESSASSDELVDGMHPDFKAAMDSYEEFMDEYVAFMKKYSDNPSDLGLLADYAKFMSEYDDFVEDFEKWEDADLNTEETKYYIEVQSRVAQKLLEVAG